jgi:hypothetical protein
MLQRIKCTVFMGFAPQISEMSCKEIVLKLQWIGLKQG